MLKVLMMSTKENWKNRVNQLKTETYAIYLASKDPRVSWYAKALIVFVVAHTFSPIDLIPDFIPVLGYVDDLIITPLGIMLAVKMIPPDVLEDCREEARKVIGQEKITSWWGAAIVVTIWLLMILLVVVTIIRVIEN
jgi:uncharacterized membrane protein YkvA (DUF1232 family)